MPENSKQAMTPDAIRQAFKDRPELWDNYVHLTALRCCPNVLDPVECDTLDRAIRILTELASLLADRQAMCEWTYIEGSISEYWKTGCNKEFSLSMHSLGHLDRLYKHCPYCGKKIEVM